MVPADKGLHREDSLHREDVALLYRHLKCRHTFEEAGLVILLWIVNSPDIDHEDADRRAGERPEQRPRRESVDRLRMVGGGHDAATGGIDEFQSRIECREHRTRVELEIVIRRPLHRVLSLDIEDREEPALRSDAQTQDPRKLVARFRVFPTGDMMPGLEPFGVPPKPLVPPRKTPDLRTPSLAAVRRPRVVLEQLREHPQSLLPDAPDLPFAHPQHRSGVALRAAFQLGQPRSPGGALREVRPERSSADLEAQRER